MVSTLEGHSVECNSTKERSDEVEVEDLFKSPTVYCTLEIIKIIH